LPGFCNQEPKILESGTQEITPKIGAMRGRNPQNPKSRSVGLETEQMLEINENGTSNCLTSVQKDNYVVTNRIRKLTPRECLRLQDFPDTFKQVVSDSQMYKQAGNSMSVNVLEMIFRQIEKTKEKNPHIMRPFTLEPFVFQGEVNILLEFITRMYVFFCEKCKKPTLLHGLPGNLGF